jgi:hypothetical protein
METKEWTFVDKSGWGDGQWTAEPDKLQWTDEATGLPCLIHRGLSGALCGYVGVSESHPLFRRDYDEADVRVHGGLTFSDMCAGQEGAGHGICHIPGPGEPDHVWWLGFDCAHSGDVCPAYDHRRSWSYESSYRDLDYVKRECASLAGQLHEAAKRAA